MDAYASKQTDLSTLPSSTYEESAFIFFFYYNFYPYTQEECAPGGRDVPIEVRLGGGLLILVGLWSGLSV